MAAEHRRFCRAPLEHLHNIAHNTDNCKVLSRQFSFNIKVILINMESVSAQLDVIFIGLIPIIVLKLKVSTFSFGYVFGIGSALWWLLVQYVQDT